MRDNLNICPKKLSFKYIFVSVLDYFYQLGKTTITGDKQALSNPGSIHVRHEMHGCEMEKSATVQQEQPRNLE